MIPAARTRVHSSGFTLVELLVSLAISAVVLTQILVVTFSLERSFAAADYRMNAQNDQLRALDYLSRDLHMASAVSVQNSGTAVPLTLPSGDPSALDLNLGTVLNPLLVGSAAPSNTTAVSYYVLGGQLIRETNGTQAVLANTVADLEFTRQDAFMIVDLLFTPQYSNSPTVAAQQNTRASSRVYLRSLITAS